MTLRNRLIAAFLASTLLPLGATVWITTTLLDRSLRYSTTAELDLLSRTLENTAKQFYQRERDALKQDALADRTRPTVYPATEVSQWPEPIRSFWESGERERFVVSGASGERVDYMRRVDNHRGQPGVEIFSRDLGGVSMEQLSTQVRETRRLVDANDTRDLRRGFTLTLLVLLGAAWLISLLPLVLIAHRVSRPIQQLTAALTDFAGGDWSRRLETGGKPGVPPRDEVDPGRRCVQPHGGSTRGEPRAARAPDTHGELAVAGAQDRARAEEFADADPADRGGDAGAAPGPRDIEARAFMDQAVQIVVSEIESLERRVRAFSEFASEPLVRPEVLDINAVVNERVGAAAAGASRGDVSSPARRRSSPRACGAGHGEWNLDESPAERGRSGWTRRRGRRDDPGRGERVLIDVHDSGPGLSEEVSATLFEPTITFKKHGMGLGLSIAKKNALLSDGDITVIPGELGGAGFRVPLPS